MRQRQVALYEMEAYLVQSSRIARITQRNPIWKNKKGCGVEFQVRHSLGGQEVRL